MTGLQIEHYWQDGGDVRTPELASTWARLRINVGEECLTVVEDKIANTFRKDIDVAAYPLAEWIAFNWWFLTTPYAGAAPGDPTHLRRYRRDVTTLRDAGDGFPWPDLALFPERGAFLATQREVHSGLQRLNFVRSGQFVLDYDDTVQTLREFVDAVVRRLEDRDIQDTRLQTEWAAILSAGAEEIAFCNAAAALGQDPYDIDDALAESIVSFDATVRNQDLLVDLLSAVSVPDLEQAQTWFTSCAEKLLDPNVPSTRGLDPGLARSVRDADRQIVPPSEPWRYGYQRARLVREQMGVPATEPFSPDTFVTTVRTSSPSPGLLEALVNVNEESAALAITQSRSETSVRFLQARSFSRTLFSQARGLQVMSHGRGMMDREERAFAAELLAPAEGIAALLDGDFSEPGLAKAAEVFSVSDRTIEHQVDNQILCFD